MGPIQASCGVGKKCRSQDFLGKKLQGGGGGGSSPLSPVLASRLVKQQIKLMLEHALQFPLKQLVCTNIVVVVILIYICSNFSSTMQSFRARAV